MSFYNSTESLQNFYICFYCIILSFYYNVEVVEVNIHIYIYTTTKEINYICIHSKTNFYIGISLLKDLNYSRFLNTKNVETTSSYDSQKLNLTHSLKLLQKTAVLPNTNYRGFLCVEVNYGGA